MIPGDATEINQDYTILTGKTIGQQNGTTRAIDNIYGTKLRSMRWQVQAYEFQLAACVNCCLAIAGMSADMTVPLRVFGFYIHDAEILEEREMV